MNKPTSKIVALIVVLSCNFAIADDTPPGGAELHPDRVCNAFKNMKKAAEVDHAVYEKVALLTAGALVGVGGGVAYMAQVASARAGREAAMQLAKQAIEEVRAVMRIINEVLADVVPRMLKPTNAIEPLQVGIEKYYGNLIEKMAPELEAKLAQALSKSTANPNAATIARRIMQELIPELRIAIAAEAQQSAATSIKHARISTSAAEWLELAITRLLQRPGSAMSEIAKLSALEGCVAVPKLKAPGPKIGQLGTFLAVLAVIGDVLTHTNDAHAGGTPKELMVKNPSLLFTNSYYVTGYGMMSEPDVCKPANSDVRNYMTGSSNTAKIFQINADILGDVAFHVAQTANAVGAGACRVGPNQSISPPMSIAPPADHETEHETEDENETPFGPPTDPNGTSHCDSEGHNCTD